MKFERFSSNEFKHDKVMLGNINILETCNKYTHREHACSWKFPDDAKRYDRARIYDGNYDGEVSIDRTKMNEENASNEI